MVCDFILEISEGYFLNFTEWDKSPIISFFEIKMIKGVNTIRLANLL